MFKFKIVFLLTIVSSSLFVNCMGNSDVVGALKNIFAGKFDHIGEFFAQQSVIEDRHSSIDGNYNDTKCYADMAILMEAFNASEPWALSGKPTKIKLGRTDMNTMIHRLIDKIGRKFREFCRWICFSFRFSIEISVRILSRCELEPSDCTGIINQACQKCDMSRIPLCARINCCFARAPLKMPEPWLWIDHLVFRRSYDSCFFSPFLFILIPLDFYYFNKTIIEFNLFILSLSLCVCTWFV